MFYLLVQEIFTDKMNINKVIHNKLFALRRKNKVQNREVAILHLDYDLEVLGFEVIGQNPFVGYSLEIDVEILPKKNYLDSRRESALTEKKEKKAPVKKEKQKRERKYKPLSDIQKQKQKEYRQKNKEKINEINRRSYQKNKEQRNQYQRDYYNSHIEEQMERDRIRYQKKKVEKGKNPTEYFMKIMNKEQFLKASKEEQITFLKEKQGELVLSHSWDTMLMIRDFILKYKKEDFNMENSSDLFTFNRVLSLIF